MTYEEMLSVWVAVILAAFVLFTAFQLIKSDPYGLLFFVGVFATVFGMPYIIWLFVGV